MKKIDLKKDWKTLYTASVRKPTVVDAPKMKFLMIDGRGDPNTDPVFQESIQALYSLAFTLKFTLKMGPKKIDYPVMALDGLWWTDSGCFDAAERDSWNWTLMIAQPDVITAPMLRAAKKQVKERKGLAAVDRVRLESWREGKAVQILHIGPYGGVRASAGKLYRFAADNGYRIVGKYHEVYLSDPHRTKPEKLKTLLRQPVAKAPR